MEIDRRIVVTALGTVSAIGAEDFEESLFSGRTGICPSERLSGATVAEIRNFDSERWLGKKGVRALDRTARLLASACQIALCSAGMTQAEESDGAPELGIVCGTMFGGLHSITSFDLSYLVDGPSYVNPMVFPNTVINAPAGQAAIKLRLSGVNSTISAGWASGLHAIDYAIRFLRLGRAQSLLAGGVEELDEELLQGLRANSFCSASGTARPFASDRNGTVPGEGSAQLLLESVLTARQRQVQPLAEIVGFGCGCEFVPLERQTGRALETSIRLALDSALIGPEQISGIVSSASGSRIGDALELSALQSVFGDRLRTIPMCAPKSATGDTLGCSGALGAVVATLALKRGRMPRTVGAIAPHPDVLLSGGELNGDVVLVLSWGCDGNSAALVMKSWAQQETN
jgi:3-oxoacyl-[acyl-carrier-protein] synthase II